MNCHFTISFEDSGTIAAMRAPAILAIEGKTKLDIKLIGFLFFLLLGYIIVIVAPKWMVLAIICIFIAIFSLRERKQNSEKLTVND